MEMDVDRGVGHYRSTAVWRGNRCVDWCSRGIVRNGDDQMIPWMDVECGIFETVGGHEAEQGPAIGIHSGLVRESDAEEAVVAEKRRRITNDGSGGEARAGIGNWWNWVKKIRCPDGAEGEKAEDEDGANSFGGRRG